MYFQEKCIDPKVYRVRISSSYQPKHHGWKQANSIGEIISYMETNYRWYEWDTLLFERGHTSFRYER